MQKESTRPPWEVADVFARFLGNKLKEQLPLQHRRVVNHIMSCRTEALGGHMERCSNCDFERPVYNSCRDRHCPKCQTMTKEKWLEARKTELLPVAYFHNVFTLPHELNDLVLCNKRVLLQLLFSAVSETLLQFGQDKRSRLCGKLGFTLILHTWNQKLLDHFHIHCVIPSGALSDDGTEWKQCKNPRFLFSVKALGVVFRSKYLMALQKAYNERKLAFSKRVADLAHPQCFDNLLQKLYQKNWVVYSKAPFGGPEQVLEYLGRYTHRVAISNHRIEDITNDGVQFSYRDRADGNKKKSIVISGEEFVRRFLLHVLPSGLKRIRHYGFLASRNKAELLSRCREALLVDPPTPTKKKTGIEMLFEKCGIDLLCCPSCKIGKMEKFAPFIKKSAGARLHNKVKVDSS